MRLLTTYSRGNIICLEIGSMTSEADLLTVPEATKYLGHTVQHTRLLIRQGKLTGYKIGRDWMVPRSAIADYNMRRSGQTEVSD